MATFKMVIVSQNKRSDGTYNVKIRVTHDRKVKYISTPFYVSSSEVTKKMNIKNQQIIDSANDLIKKYRTICNTVGDLLNGMSVDQVKDLITKDYSGKWSLDFIDYGRQVIEKLNKSGHIGNARTYEVALNSLVRFLGCDRLDVLDINTKFIQSYIDWVESTPSNSNRVKGGRAASLYISNIKALYNKAKVEYNDEDTGIIRIPYSPFVKIKVPTAPPSIKRALTIDQIQQIIKLQDRKSYQNRISLYNFARDMFTLSFCLVGMNTADLYNCVNCLNGSIIYQRTKTKNRRSDKAEISIRIEPEVLPLIEKYRDMTGERVFNFHQHYKDANIFNYAINKGLKLIGDELSIEDLESYAARHSWATIALNDCGVDKYTVHTALNHVDADMKVTDIYIKKDFTIIAEANRKVLSKFQF